MLRDEVLVDGGLWFPSWTCLAVLVQKANICILSRCRSPTIKRHARGIRRSATNTTDKKYVVENTSKWKDGYGCSTVVMAGAMRDISEC